MSEKIIKKYCRRVGNALICQPKRKKELLSGLEAELSALQPEEVASIPCLEAKYGEIVDVAAAYQEAVPEAERMLALRRKRRNRWLWAVLAIAVIILFLLLTIFLLKMSPFTRVTMPVAEIS